MISYSGMYDAYSVIIMIHARVVWYNRYMHLMVHENIRNARILWTI